MLVCSNDTSGREDILSKHLLLLKNKNTNAFSPNLNDLWSDVIVGAEERKFYEDLYNLPENTVELKSLTNQE